MTLASAFAIKISALAKSGLPNCLVFVPRPLSFWKKCRFPIETAGVRAAVFLVGMLNRKCLTLLARGMAAVAHRVDSRGRAIALENLRLVLPDKDEPELKRILRRSYHHQAMSALDLMWAPRHLTQETAASLIELSFEDKEEFEAIRHGPVVWVTAHYGCFEWLSLLWGLTGKTDTMIVAEDFRNPGLTPIFKRMREYSGVTTVPQERAMVRLLKHIRRGGQTAFLADLRVTPSKAATIIDCFGLKTSVTILHAFLAKQTGAPIVPVICLPKPDHTYRFHCHRRLQISEEATPQEIAQQCWDVFEQSIRDRPEPWMWMYKQWRYLPKNTSRAYPNYASHSEAYAQVESRLEP